MKTEESIQSGDGGREREMCVEKIRKQVKVPNLNEFDCSIANGSKYLSFQADLNASSHLLFNSRIGNRKSLVI